MSRVVFGLVLAVVFASASGADEGMWRPGQLVELEERLRGLGLEIDPARLGDLTGHPMNAVISLGGCTASFVSPTGLVITNYHCAKGAIQYNSTEERNLLDEGFLAEGRSGELPAGPGSRVLVTVAVDDVTARVNEAAPEGATGAVRYRALDDRKKALVAECERQPGYRCSVRAYHGGLEYELIRQLEIRDVRLVHAPAAMIGEYGGEIDNWMWPRHTGDYAFYRAYVGPDGQPADPAEENVPYRPAHHLEISTSGLAPGDLVMVAGYPGTTNRYRLADEVEHVFGWWYPHRKRAFETWRAVIAEAVAADADLEIRYASLIAGLDNATKNYGGMLDGFAKSDIVERKRRLEEELEAWIEADAERGRRYLSTLSELRALIAAEQGLAEREMFYEYLARRGELMRTATTLYRLARERQKPDPERESGYQERDMRRIEESLQRIERTFAPAVDRAFWRHHLLRYAEIPVQHHVEAFDAWFGIEGNRVDADRLDAVLERMYAETGLGDTASRLAWMEKEPAELEASADPFLRLAVALYPSDMEIEEERKELDGRFDELRPRFMEALIAFLEGRGEAIYPDANSTLRVTFGTVEGYRPRDGVLYTPFTRLEGIVEKHTGEEPFDVPDGQLAAIAAGEFGPYVSASLGSVPVNFLSTVDTTGGNSGSPTLDAHGRLAGLLFDGNWESIVSDWDFLPQVTRSIHVDIRYALWVMERVDGAAELLRELGVEPAAPPVAP